MSIKQGDHVRVKPYSRVRTIFITSELTPGKTYDKPSYTGRVLSVEDNGMGGDTFYIQSDKPRGGPGVQADISYEYHSEEELEII